MLLLLLLLPALASCLIVIPQPNGTYGVSLTDLEFVQKNRTDPYTYARDRKLIVSLIEPVGPVSACQPIQQMYMPNTTAVYWEQEFLAQYDLSLNDTLSQLALSLCQKPKKSQSQEEEGSYPLVVFSPGLAFPRQFYSILATNIAAQGFTVVTVDVPGEDNIVTFLNGVVEYGDPLVNDVGELDEAQAEIALDIRVKDISFILDTLTAHYKRYGVNTTSPSVFGHSLGGDTALSAMEADERFVGGCDLDGSLHGKPLNQTSEKPFLIFGHGQHNQTGAQGWTQVWNNLLGPKWQLELDNSTHDSFTDTPIIAEMVGLYRIPGVTSILGSIDPQESLKVQTSVLSTLAGYLAGQKPVKSVLEVAESFSDVVVYNATDVGN